MATINGFLGLVYLGLLIFAIWMWVDALSHPAHEWIAAGKRKGYFFAAWYVGGILTLGLAPMGMSIWYYRKIRPALRQVGAGQRGPQPSASAQTFGSVGFESERKTPPVPRSPRQWIFVTVGAIFVAAGIFWVVGAATHKGGGGTAQERLSPTPTSGVEELSASAAGVKFGFTGPCGAPNLEQMSAASHAGSPWVASARVVSTKPYQGVNFLGQLLDPDGNTVGATQFEQGDFGGVPVVLGAISPGVAYGFDVGYHTNGPGLQVAKCTLSLHLFTNDSRIIELTDVAVEPTTGTTDRPPPH